MKFQEYVKYSNWFSGKADSDFELKFKIKEISNLSAEKAFFKIDTLGETPEISSAEKQSLLSALKGKAAFNLAVKQVSEQIKIAHKEKWIWILGNISFDEKIKDLILYQEVIQNLLNCDNRQLFLTAWKQSRVENNLK